MIFCFDIDGTLCTNTDGEYEAAEPIHHMIGQVNALYDSGNRIVLFTARGGTTGIDWRDLTASQMKDWGVKHHELIMGKPQADVYIDDKGLSIAEWATNMPAEARAAIDKVMNHPADQPTTPPPAGKETRTGKEQSIVDKSEYLSVIYSKDRRPESDYPARLARHLRTAHAPDGGRLLDIGCGRGDMLRALAAVGFDVAGVDISPSVEQLCAPLEAHCVDLTTDPLPFQPESFDVVFSKSVIEHLHNPLPFLEKAVEALKPDGRAIIMTPSWLHHGWGPFYLDHTHVTPFTAPSLRDTMEIAGFRNVEVVHFYQLPFLWSCPALTPLVQLFAKLPLHYSPMYDMTWKWPDGFNKLIRFSKEAMLLAIGTK